MATPDPGDAAARRPVYVVDGCRTPFLKARDEPGPFSAADLAVAAGRPLLARQTFEPDDLNQVIVGCLLPAQDEINVAHAAALRLGCSNAVPAWNVQRNCASGMQALDSAVRAIAAGDAELILAGGTEAMSRAPVLFNEALVAWLARWRAASGTWLRARCLARFRPAYMQPVWGLRLALTDAISGLSMGQIAEELAYRFRIDRDAMDRYAAESHRRLAAAQEEGRLDEVVPVYDYRGRYYDRDDGVRPDTNLAALAQLRPAFDRQFGGVTAGNSAQLADGAAWLLLAGEAAVRRFDLPVRARISAWHWAGLDAGQTGLGPVHAITPLLQHHGWGLEDVDYWEIDEAFAAQVLACLAAWADPAYCRAQLGLDGALGELDQARLNVDGGAIAMGHPLGAGGSRIVLHLIDVLARHGARRGVAAMCAGGGQGGALVVEREA